MITRKLNIIAALFFCINSLFAQDPHLSQSDAYLNYSNMASVGMMDADFKMSGIYRSQWGSIQNGFKTYGVSFEQKVNAFSYGIDILARNTVPTSIKQSNLRLKASYNKVLSDRSSLRVGAAFGAIQQRFNPEDFSFDKQFIPGSGFNSANGNGENFENTNVISPDLSAGLMLLNKVGKLENEIGASILHLNQPKATIYADGNTVYPLRTFLHLKSKYPVNEKLGIYGLGQYSTQVPATEIIIGAGFDYLVSENKTWNFSVSSRIDDALIFATAIKSQNFELGISYDATRSALSSASNGASGIEISTAYYFNKKEKDVIPDNEYLTYEMSDRDNDLTPDHLDECPDTPGFPRFNGCNDKDKDGVYDLIDACPNLFGHESNKGCPVEQLQDSDMDGLVDDVDECPFLKGLPEHKGCPDSDKDGISDKIDNCPFLKGTSKNNGCPQRSIMDFGKKTSDSMANVHVNFETNQSTIEASYFTKLNAVVNYLNENPDSKIYISGHTDTEGDPAFNYALGEKRANEVMNYFLKNGISITRISSISYGETKPIHKNNNVYGKAKNRRVEVIIIEE